MIYDPKQNENVDPSQFEFVQQNQDIHDTKFQTKPIGYFKDAMIRFTKNRSNVIASLIMIILILLAVVVPEVAPKSALQANYRLQTLPPKVPILDKLGIFTGYRTITDQTADLTNQDPKTGLYFPEEPYKSAYIIPGTLKNYSTACTLYEPECVGGQTDLDLFAGYNSVLIQTNDYPVTNSTKTINIGIKASTDNNITTNSQLALNVLIQTNATSPFKVIYSITKSDIPQSGIVSITLKDIPNLDLKNLQYSQIEFQLVNNGSTTSQANAYINSLTVDGSNAVNYSGYDLWNDFTLLTPTGSSASGNLGRVNGEIKLASFVYNTYAAAFGPYEIKALPASEFDSIMAKYGDKCTKTSVSKDNPDIATYSSSCPIMQVLGVSPKIAGPGGVLYYSYDAIVNYGLYEGYSSDPYFLFGTTWEGENLFVRVWLGLRTDLFIGFVVSLINIIIGIVYGAIEGYYGGKIDLLMQRFEEVVGRIPFLAQLALFVIVFGSGPITLILLLTITGWIGIADITRMQFYRYKRREYVLASQTLGASDSRIIFRHILPNGIGTIITLSILNIPQVIFLEATVGYLGYGLGHTSNISVFHLFTLSGVSLGVLLADGEPLLQNFPYLTIVPAIIVSILMITFNMFGNALRDAFNPALRGNE